VTLACLPLPPQIWLLTPLRNPFRYAEGDIDNRVRAIAAQMNLQAVMWTGVGDNNELLFDTQDFDVAAGLMNATEAFSQWTAFLDTNLNKIDNGFISLEHGTSPTLLLVSRSRRS
jgi:hypothetical protein